MNDGKFYSYGDIISRNHPSHLIASIFSINKAVKLLVGKIGSYLVRDLMRVRKNENSP